MQLNLRTIEEEAEVTKPVLRRRAADIVMVASIALVFVLSSVAQSSAECVGYCEARQTLKMCHHAVRTQGLQASAREAEFEKCKANPLSYLAKPGRNGT
jgi:hypothetical protein